MSVKRLTYAVFFLALSVSVFSGCKKNDETLQPNYNNNTGDLVYELSGGKNVSLERVGEAKLQINVERVSGSKTTEVQLGASDLPDGLDVVFDVQKSTPPFIAFATIVGTRIKEGTYTINITASGTNTDFKRYPVSVKILPYTNEANGVKGDYTETHQCDADGSKNFKVAVIADRDTPNRVTFKGFWTGTYVNEVYAYLDGATHTITIPQQTKYNITYKGSGTYTDDQILINYTANSDIVNDACTAVFDRIQK